ncbi:hypothetical protein, partial [Lactobacillus equicursoris]|uniref:hypothetical protein n=1 Tax=Lactobacillus equicursoris TaxID=420645 RepID=UPI001EE2E97D
MLKKHRPAGYTIVFYNDAKRDCITSLECIYGVINQIVSIVCKAIKALEGNPIFGRRIASGKVSIAHTDITYRSADFFGRTLDLSNGVAVELNLTVGCAQATTKLAGLSLKF